MFEFISINKPVILDAFLENIETKYSDDLENTSFNLSDVGFDKIGNNQSILGSYTHIKDLCLRLIMKYIPLEKGYSLTEERVGIRYHDYLHAKHMLLYYRINALVEILGRESGIQFYKDFVQYWGKELAKKEQTTTKYEELRKSAVKFWKDSNAFEFGVTDIDERAFLAKFDRCVWHESMKDVDDQELAYLTVCYPGPRVGRYTRQNVWLRRSVTLFTGDFCDELRWDRHVHDEPEQPSQDFSRKMIPK